MPWNIDNFRSSSIITLAPSEILFSESGGVTNVVLIYQSQYGVENLALLLLVRAPEMIQIYLSFANVITKTVHAIKKSNMDTNLWYSFYQTNGHFGAKLTVILVKNQRSFWC